MAVLFLLPPALRAQAGVTIPPSNIIPNYNRVSVGQREALEAGAYVARTDNALANWYNPAGLVLSKKTALNASSNAYELTKTTIAGIGPATSSNRFSPVVGFFGIVIGEPIAKKPRLRFGFGYTRPVAWSPSTIRGSLGVPVGGGAEGFGYSTTVNFGTSIPSLNAAYRISPRVRVGLGIGVGITNLTQNQAVTDQFVLPTAVTSGIRVFSTDGNVYHLLFSAGAQWDVTRTVTVGGLLTAPGLRIGGSSSVTLSQTVFTAGGASNNVTFGDPSAKFDYQIPLRVVAGAAYRYSRGQVELDLRYFGGRGSYALFSSDSTAVQITANAAGVPTITNPAFTPVPNQARSFVGVAVGGSYSLSRAFRLHVGFFIDPSPVSAPSQSSFRAVDLTGVSGGVSFGSGRLTASLGASSSWGTTSERDVGPSLGGLQATTDESIRTITLLYAVSFTF